MYHSAAQGNAPERWQALLSLLDEKLQFGLLEHLRKVKVYHFEGDVLYLETASEEAAKTLSSHHVFQQLEIMAQDSTGVTAVKIK